MRVLRPALWLLTAVLAGCMAGNVPAPAQAPPAGAPPASTHHQLGSPFAERPARSALDLPLLIDRNEYRLGTTAQFRHVPTVAELRDAEYLLGLQHIVLALDTWPTGFDAIQTLNQMPADVDCIVLLAGYPPTRASLEAWNMLNVRPRIVLVTDGPPANSGVSQDLNTMRGLERVIARMDTPSRSGFERLQRPLSFVKAVD